MRNNNSTNPKLMTTYTPKGLHAQVATQCECPDTGKTGTFLFSGESHRNKGSRVTPVYADFYELCKAEHGNWESVPGTMAQDWIKL